jgi:parallel beta-helix repeat protein
MAVAHCALLIAASLIFTAGVNCDSENSSHALQYDNLGGIFIFGDENFTADHGVTAGNGTYLNPYIIEDMEINASSEGGGLYIQFTTAYVVIRNLTVHSGLIVLFENETGAGFTGSDGITLRTASNCRIENCTFSGNAAGIGVMWGSSNVLIEHNTITQNLRGITVESCNLVTIRNNEISHNLGDNVELLQASYCTLVNNTIDSPGKWSTTSLNLYDSDYCEVHFNHVGDAEDLGINVGYCSNCDVTNNTIVDNRIGITVYGAVGVTYLPNIFLGNLEDVQDWDDQNTWLPGVAILIAWIGTIIMAGALVAVYMRKRKAPPVGSDQKVSGETPKN